MSEPLRFVIQQHDATRLHWDLRLEHAGVLRSWALPRGIPWNPKENRLAVATEDHSLDFLDHDGDDADPGYGTGRLTTWDRGTYEAHKWRDDEVIVTLDGQRTTGKYALFSMRGGRDWLIHRMDPPDDEDRLPVAVGIQPMQATGGELPGIDDQIDDGGGGAWVFEPRWRGVRALVTDDTGRIVITDEHGDNISMQFPEVRRIGRALGHRELILDGVIVPVEPYPAGGLGAVRFDGQGIARRMRIRSDSGARNASRTAPMVFMAFDVLWVDGRPVTGLPWELRRRQLDDLRLDGPGWRTSPLLDLDAVFAHVDDGNGVVAKRRDGLYEVAKVSTAWIAVAGVSRR